MNASNNFRDKGYFILGQQHYQSTFTEKIQTRAYTIDDVVGTIGGYVGLFMGYAVVQFPNIVRSLMNFAQRRFSNIEEAKD